MKTTRAARVADALRRESGCDVETVRGRLGEMRVTLDGEDLYASKGLLHYPSVQTVLGAVRGRLPL